MKKYIIVILFLLVSCNKDKITEEPYSIFAFLSNSRDSTAKIEEFCFSEKLNPNLNADSTKDDESSCSSPDIENNIKIYLNDKIDISEGITLFPHFRYIGNGHVENNGRTESNQNKELYNKLGKADYTIGFSNIFYNGIPQTYTAFAYDGTPVNYSITIENKSVLTWIKACSNSTGNHCGQQIDNPSNSNTIALTLPDTANPQNIVLKYNCNCQQIKINNDVQSINETNPIDFTLQDTISLKVYTIKDNENSITIFNVSLSKMSIKANFTENSNVDVNLDVTQNGSTIQKMSLSFNNSIDPTTVNTTNIKLYEGETDISEYISPSLKNKTIEIKIIKNLRYGKKHTLKVGTGLKDNSGQCYIPEGVSGCGEYTQTFTTKTYKNIAYKHYFANQAMTRYYTQNSIRNDTNLTILEEFNLPDNNTQFRNPFTNKWIWNPVTPTSQYLYAGNVKGDDKKEIITLEILGLTKTVKVLDVFDTSNITTVSSTDSTYFRMLHDTDNDGYDEIGIGERNGNNIHCKFVSVNTGSVIIKKEFIKAAYNNAFGYPTLLYTGSDGVKKVICITNTGGAAGGLPRGFTIFNISTGAEINTYLTGAYAENIALRGDIFYPTSMFSPNNGIINTNDDNDIERNDTNTDTHGLSFTFNKDTNKRILKAIHPAEGYAFVPSNTNSLCDPPASPYHLPIFECFLGGLSLASGGHVHNITIKTDEGLKFFAIQNRGNFYYQGYSKIFNIDEDTIIRNTFTGAPNVGISPIIIDIDNDGSDEILFSYSSDEPSSIPNYPQVLLDKDLNSLAKFSAKGVIFFAADVLGKGKPQFFVGESNSLVAYELNYSKDEEGNTTYTFDEVKRIEITNDVSANDGTYSPIYEAIPTDLDNDGVLEIITRSARKITVLKANPI